MPASCAGFSQNGSVGVSGKRDPSQGDFESHDMPTLDANGVDVHTVAASQQRAVDIEQSRHPADPRQTPLESAVRALVVLLNCLHAVGETVSPGGSLACRSKYRTFASRRTLEPGANFREADAQFSHGAAEGVAVDSQLFSRLALVSPVCGQHFAQDTVS